MRQAETEQLRQERETFEFNMREASAWSRLRLFIGYCAPVVMLAIFALCSFVIVDHDQFDPGADKWAMGVLGLDILGLVGTVINLVFNPSHARPLAPVTHALERSSAPQLPSPCPPETAENP